MPGVAKGAPERHVSNPGASSNLGDVKVLLRNPSREVSLDGPMRVGSVLDELDVNPESVIVIRGDDLVTSDVMIGDDDTIELRPVISGGSS